MFKIFKEALSNDAKNKGGDAEAHDIKYGEWDDKNKPYMAKKTYRKTLGCAPSMREVYTNFEGYDT